MITMKHLRTILTIFGVFVFLFLLLMFAIFKLSFIPYPPKPTKYDPVICYSQNHEYYIKRYQTVADSLWNDNGIAIVYDKQGHEVSRGKAYLAADTILWSPSYGGAVGIGEGGKRSEWYIKLPTLPVKIKNTADDYAAGCY